MDIGTTIIDWYKTNGRELPWRNTKDPYHIWVSEIILQQTRIDQGLPYYINFIKLFPNVFALAKAKEDHVLLAWQGLGYYSRARNMHFTAQSIVKDLDGVFPSSSKDLIKLKGIGKYTSAAISSICNNENIPAIDGNATRVIARLFNINKPVNKPETAKEIEVLSEKIIKNKNASDYNQAMMDLGATICTPKLPKCSICPVQTKCLSFSKGTFNAIPIKENKTKITNRYFAYLVLKTNTHVLISKRKNNDIWKGLHEFMLIELKAKPLTNNILDQQEIQEYLTKYSTATLKIFKAKPHKLSHQTLFAWFITIDLQKLPNTNAYFPIHLNEIYNYAFPKLIERHLKEIL